MRLTLVLISMIFFSAYVCAQELTIIPQPVSIKQPRIAAKFTISPATQIVLEGSNLQHSANFFNDYLQQFYLFKNKSGTAPVATFPLKQFLSIGIKK